MRPGIKCFGLFGPALVLITWAIYLAIHDRQMSEPLMIVFLLVLAGAVVVAEIIRIHKRQKIMQRVHRERNERPNT